MIASHVSEEPGAKRVLEELRLNAPLHAGMCLGEGTGALMLFPMLDMIVDIYDNMSSFEDINVEQYQRLSKH